MTSATASGPATRRTYWTINAVIVPEVSRALPATGGLSVRRAGRQSRCDRGPVRNTRTLRRPRLLRSAAVVTPAHLWTFVAAATVLIIVPGPSVLFVVSRGVTIGRRAALLTVAGNALGEYVQVV